MPMAVSYRRSKEDITYQRSRAASAPTSASCAGSDSLRQTEAKLVVLGPRVSRQVVHSYVRPPDAETGLEALSPRQREILKAIASGSTTKQIAYDLGLSIKTIETHRAQIMERLDIHDAARLVRFSICIGLISAHD